MWKGPARSFPKRLLWPPNEMERERERERERRKKMDVHIWRGWPIAVVITRLLFSFPFCCCCCCCFTWKHKIEFHTTVFRWLIKFCFEKVLGPAETSVTSCSGANTIEPSPRSFISSVLFFCLFFFLPRKNGRRKVPTAVDLCGRGVIYLPSFLIGSLISSRCLDRIRCQVPPQFLFCIRNAHNRRSSTTRFHNSVHHLLMAIEFDLMSDCGRHGRCLFGSAGRRFLSSFLFLPSFFLSSFFFYRVFFFRPACNTGKDRSNLGLSQFASFLLEVASNGNR